MNISVIGTGYVGLVTAVGLSECGNRVVGYDIDKEKVASLKRGVPVIHEEGLERLLGKNLSAGRLDFTGSIEETVSFSDLIFVGVGTPPKDDGSADIQAVREVCQAVSKIATGPKIVVIKSTVPPGTAELIRQEVDREKIEIVSNPEFLREGVAIKDFLEPDRILIGTKSQNAVEILKVAYRTLLAAGTKLVVTDNASAELSKYACNAFLAAKISFINEMSRVCDTIGANVQSVKTVMGLDDRIGSKFLNSGIGFGGSCFPKDLLALENLSEQLALDVPLLRSVWQSNRIQKERFIGQIIDQLRNSGDGPVTVWGITFKPDTDDIRESPALDVVSGLVDAGFSVKVFDPVFHLTDCTEIAKRYGFELVSEKYEALSGSIGLVLCTEWATFEDVDFERVDNVMKESAVFDGRNLWASRSDRAPWLKFYYNIGNAGDLFVHDVLDGACLLERAEEAGELI